MITYCVHLIVVTGIYSLVVLGLRIAIGKGKVMLITPTVSMAAGAYCYAVLATFSGWPPLVAALCAVSAGAFLGDVSGLLATRLRGDHLVLASLGLCEIVRSLLNNCDRITNGSIGIMNIPFLLGSVPRDARLGAALFMTIAAVLAAIGLSIWIDRQPFGLVHAALDGDEAGCETLGRRVARTKRTGAALGGLVGSTGGVLFASYMSYVDPTTFAVSDAVIIFAMLAVGGLDSPYGVFVGATVFVMIPELVRFVGLPESIADPLRRILCGLLLLIVVRLRPHGLLYLAGRQA